MWLNTLGVLELPESDVSEEKPLLLLAYLAHEASDGWLAKGHVAELIWPFSKRAVHSLNHAFHTLYKRGNAKSHIERKSGSIRVSGVRTDAQALFEACEAENIVHIKQLYARGQFLQSLNPDQVPELYQTWILPMQEKVRAAVWRAYLDALVARPDRVAERLDEAYALAGELPAPSSGDFARCVCLQRLFGLGGSYVARALGREIGEFGITHLPESDEEARAFLGLPETLELAVNLDETRASEAVASRLADSPVEPTAPARTEEESKGPRFWRHPRLAAVASATVFLVAGLGVWAVSSGVFQREAVSVTETSERFADRAPLDIPVAEQVLQKMPQVDDPQAALLLAAEAAYALQGVAAGTRATRTLRERVLRATEPWQTQLEHNVLFLEFSPNGRWLLVGGEDPALQLWDMHSDATEPYARLEHEGTVSSALFSASGDAIVTGSSDEKVRLWNIQDPAQPVRTLAHESTVYALAESPDGRWLATGTRDGKAQLWSLEAPDAPPTELRDHVGWVTSLAFSPDGSLLLTGGDQRGVNLYRLKEGPAPVAEAIELVEASTIRFGQDLPLIISPDGRWAAAGRPDSAVHLFDLSDPEGKQRILQGHGDHVRALVFSPDSTWLASGSRDGDVRVWDPAKGDEGRYVLRGHEGWVMRLEASEDGRTLLSASDDATVRLWNMALDPPEARVFSDHPHQVRAATLNTQGWLATGSYEGDTLVQNVERSRYDLPNTSVHNLINVACKVAGRNLTAQEWRRAVNEVSHRETCS